MSAPTDWAKKADALADELCTHVPELADELILQFAKEYASEQHTALLAEVEALRRHWGELAYHANVLACAKSREERDAATSRVCTTIGNAKDQFPGLRTLEEAKAHVTEVEALRGALLECIVSIEHRAPREEMECTVERARLALAPRSAEEPKSP
jgi:hypothetical protein